MANEAETEWQAFRRYRIRGVDILERPGRIEFNQMNSHSRKGAGVVFLVLVGVWFGPIVVIIAAGLGRDPAVTAVAYFFLAMLPVAALMGIGYLIIRRPTVLEITPGQVVIDNANEKFVLPPERVKNVEVRQTGMRSSIFVWDGAVPLYTFSLKTQQEAIAIKEGIMLAIRAVNSAARAVAAEASSSPAFTPAPPNPFPE